MTRERWIAAAKIAWVVVVLAIVARYVAGHGAELRRAWDALSWNRALAALLFLVVAKVLLAHSARLALRAMGFALGWRESLRMYSVSQLGKYAPGGVWHYVGRFAMYRLRGAGARTATTALVAESAWLLASAVLIGTIGALPALCGLAGLEPTPVVMGAVRAILLVVWAAAIAIATRATHAAVSDRRPIVVAAMASQAAIWVLLGLSFWTIIPAGAREAVTVAHGVGTFALAWAAGYAAVFAPAGLGVREAVMVALLRGAMPLEAALVLAAVSRAVWTVGELALGLVFLADRGAAVARGDAIVQPERAP